LPLWERGVYALNVSISMQYVIIVQLSDCAKLVIETGSGNYFHKWANVIGY